ncbi:10127_t:CDS:2, partial [Acaulospora morrowiae]
MASSIQSVQDPWSPSNYSLNASFVHTIPLDDLISLLSPESHERILDLGCGDGTLTFKLQQMCKECIGIDKSQKMIEAARKKGCKNLSVVDGEKLEDWVVEQGLEGSFDAEAVIEGVRRCLKPGGRFVAELGGHGNVQGKYIIN